MSTGDSAAPSPPEVVAAVPAAPVKKTSIVDMIWNDSTKLTIYLAIWYLGNIYCKLKFRSHENIKKTLEKH
jgi:hypothetical protein